MTPTLLLQAFFYDVLRDVACAGAVEHTVRELELLCRDLKKTEVVYTNKHLAAYAEEVATRVITALEKRSAAATPYEFERTLVVGTAHLPALEMTRLLASEWSIGDEYMTVVRVNQEPGTQLNPADIGPNFEAAAKLALSLGCSHVKFDRDANTVEKLKVFDW